MAEIKPFEPETGNAGVGRKMKYLLLHSVYVGHLYRHTQNRSEKCSGKDYRYVSRKHHHNNFFRHIR